MNLADRLASWGDLQRFPFFGGWVDPAGANPTLQCGDVKLDEIAGAPSGDKFLRAYYRRIEGGVCDTAVVRVYVHNYGLETEAAYRQDKPQIPRMGVGLIAERLKQVAPAVQIYGAVLGATQSGDATTKLLASTFAPLLNPETGSGLDMTSDATIDGINQMVALGVLTQEQADLLINIPLPDFV